MKGKAFYFRVESALRDKKTELLSLEQLGILDRLEFRMHALREPLPEDERLLAKICRTTTGQIRKAIPILVSGRHIQRISGGYWSEFIEEELQYFADNAEKNRKNAKFGHEKRQRNQQNDDANALPLQKSRVE